MSAITYSTFDTVSLTTSAANIYAMPNTAGTLGRNIQFQISNITNAAVTVTLYRVPSGASAADSNAFVKDLAIPASDYKIIDVPRLSAADIVQGLASSASAINVNPYRGDEFNP